MISLVLGLVLVTGFVVAYSQTNQVTIEIKKGWNLIPASSWEIQDHENSPLKYPQDFKYGYIYDVLDKKYVLGLKDGETIPSRAGIINTNNDDPDIVRYYNQASMWVYSEKEGDLILRWMGLNPGIFEISNYNLYSGWNFIFITPDIADVLFNQREIAGTCNIERSYFFNAENQDWVSYSVDTLINEIDGPDDEDFIGLGWVIKVTSDCTLGSSGSGGTSPPVLPGVGDVEECSDTDGGIDYNVKGHLIDEGSNADYYDYCLDSNNAEEALQSGGDVVEEGVVLREHYCGEINYQYEYYDCPNGCSDGACL